LGSPAEYQTIIGKYSSLDGEYYGVLMPASFRMRNVLYYEGYLPNGFKFWTKVDKQEDSALGAVALGVIEPMIILDRGDILDSPELAIQIRAVRNSK
jgi:hypothetical protein